MLPVSKPSSITNLKYACNKQHAAIYYKNDYMLKCLCDHWPISAMWVESLHIPFTINSNFLTDVLVSDELLMKLEGRIMLRETVSKIF
jgi:hypothetical protein